MELSSLKIAVKSPFVWLNCHCHSFGNVCWSSQTCLLIMLYSIYIYMYYTHQVERISLDLSVVLQIPQRNELYYQVKWHIPLFSHRDRALPCFKSSHVTEELFEFLQSRLDLFWDEINGWLWIAHHQELLNLAHWFRSHSQLRVMEWICHMRQDRVWFVLGFTA